MKFMLVLALTLALFAYSSYAYNGMREMQEQDEGDVRRKIHGQEDAIGIEEDEDADFDEDDAASDIYLVKGKQKNW